MIKKCILSLLVSPMLLANLAAAGTYEPVVLFDLTTRPTNAGINPNFTAVEVKGTVLLGSNPCFAQGVKAKLVSERIAERIEVTALRDRSATRGRFCTMEYNPQYAEVATVVRYDHSLVNTILVKNVGEMGNDQEL